MTLPGVQLGFWAECMKCKGPCLPQDGWCFPCRAKMRREAQENASSDKGSPTSLELLRPVRRKPRALAL